MPFYAPIFAEKVITKQNLISLSHFDGIDTINFVTYVVRKLYQIFVLGHIELFDNYVTRAVGPTYFWPTFFFKLIIMN